MVTEIIKSAKTKSPRGWIDARNWSAVQTKGFISLVDCVNETICFIDWSVDKRRWIGCEKWSAQISSSITREKALIESVFVHYRSFESSSILKCSCQRSSAVLKIKHLAGIGPVDQRLCTHKIIIGMVYCWCNNIIPVVLLLPVVFQHYYNTDKM